MLILVRKLDDTVDFETSDGIITIAIKNLSPTRVSLGIDAPKSVKVVRGELKNKTQSK